MRSYYEANARERLDGIVDAGSFREILPATARTLSPHLAALDLPAAFDDGVVIGSARLDGMPILIAAQEGGFMGGAVGEVQGAKLVGLLERARGDGARGERIAGVVLLLESGGVRLQEANAGLIAVSEVIRAICATRVAGIPVVAAIGGQYGCFGGMGIAAACCSRIVMSEEGRLGLSGPEVIETARGVEEFDSRDRALVWRTVGGKHRYLIGDCEVLVDDRQDAFRAALSAVLRNADTLDLAALEREQAMLERRVERFGACRDGSEIWRALGFERPEEVAMMTTEAMVAMGERLRAA
jgi:malonate decarboxylase beta subunit